MRRIGMTVIALALVAAPAVLEAQPVRGSEARVQARRGVAVNPAGRVLALRSELNLTAAQVAQLEQLRVRFEEQNRLLIEQLQAQRPEGVMPGGARRGMAGGPAQLTEEQRAAMRTQMQARRQQGATGRPQLTEEQRAEMRAQMQARRQQGAARRELTEEQRAELAQRRAGMRDRAQQLQPLMQQLRQNTESARAQVEAVLTSEQVAKLREVRPAAARQGGARGGRPGR